MDDLEGTYRLGSEQGAVDAALKQVAGQNIVRRMWEHDHRVWKDNPAEITNRLGWLHSPAAMRAALDRLGALRRDVKSDQLTHGLLLGMGGSSLAPELFAKVFGPVEAGMKLSVLDSTDPGAVLDYARALDPARTLYIFSSKSGTTVEMLSFFKYFYRELVRIHGAGEAGSHFLAITDPGSKLAELGQRYGFRAVFENDPNIGGRYSALTFFGLVPAALVGVEVKKLLDRAEAVLAACGPDAPADQNPGARLGATLGALALAGRDKLTLITSPHIAAFGDWVEQLIAESTGKEGKGILPVVGETPGAPELYGPDRAFVSLRMRHDELSIGPLQALEEAGHPIIQYTLHDLYDLGGQFALWEVATAVAGHVLGINPFDQPNVESAKKRATAMVNAFHESGRLPESNASPVSSEALEQFLTQGKPGDYVALQAFVQPTQATAAALDDLRLRLRDRTHLAATVGYGPRYLHSTGQLHKGDGGRGLFVVLTSDSEQDAPIPDEADSDVASMSFGVLKLAQALGDKAALADAGRRVIHFHLGRDVVGGIRTLAQGIK